MRPKTYYGGMSMSAEAILIGLLVFYLLARLERKNKNNK